VFDDLRRGPLIADATKPAHRHGIERFLVLLSSRVLARLSGWHFSQRKGHDSLAWGVLWLCGLPEIHTRSRYLEALVVIEDTVYILGTGHVHDPEAERMAMFIPHHLGKHHRSKRDKGLTKRVIGAKVGQPADMDFGTHVYPPGKKTTFKYNSDYACRITIYLLRIAHFREVFEVRECPTGASHSLIQCN
jgi:hypothetical protein